MGEEKQGVGGGCWGQDNLKAGRAWRADGEVQQHGLLVTKEETQMDTSKCKFQLHDFRLHLSVLPLPNL